MVTRRKGSRAAFKADEPIRYAVKSSAAEGGESARLTKFPSGTKRVFFPLSSFFIFHLLPFLLVLCCAFASLDGLTICSKP